MKDETKIKIVTIAFILAISLGILTIKYKTKVCDELWQQGYNDAFKNGSAILYSWDDNIFNFSDVINEQGKVTNETTVMHNLTLQNIEKDDFYLRFSVTINSDILFNEWKYFNISINNETLYGKTKSKTFVYQSADSYICGNETKQFTIKVTFFESPTATILDGQKFLCYLNVHTWKDKLLVKIPFWIYT